MKKLPYAEEINYWQTSRTSPDTWIEKACKQIEKLGGTITGEAFGREPQTGRSAYMLSFFIDGNPFKVVWPVLPSKTGKEKSARIQAATLLYHDIKAKSISAFVLGSRNSFFSYLVLKDGRTTSSLLPSELQNNTPKLFMDQLVESTIDGDYIEMETS